MKTSLAAITLLIFSFESTAQFVSLFELISQNLCPDPACYESYMTNNRFEFVAQEGNTYSYQSIDYVDAQNGMQNRTTAQIQFYHRGLADAEVITSVMTANSDYHDELVSEMDEYHFVVSHTKPTSDGATCVIFLSEDYPSFELWVTMRYMEQQGGTLVYNFAIIRDVPKTDEDELPSLQSLEDAEDEIDYQDVFENISLAGLMSEAYIADFESFDEFADEYGYVFESKNDTGAVYLTIGYVETELDDVVDKNQITLEFYPDNNETLTTMTTSIPYYTDNLMEELAGLKFVQVGGEVVNDDGSVSVMYEAEDEPEFEIIVNTWLDSVDGESYRQTQFIISRFDE